jgi:ABC-2 type transport system permease protein
MGQRKAAAMKRPSFVVLASALAIVAFAGLNVAAYRWLAPVRADFTGGRLYTLSDSAGKVVRRLAEPVELELVFSRTAAADYPALRAHAGRTREMLAAIAARSGGKVRIRETDPEPFSEEEDRVALAGIQALGDGAEDPIHLGLIGRNSVDDEIVIPFLSPDRDALLEYDLVRLIAQLDNPDPAEVVVLSGLPAFASDGRSETDPLLLREMARAFRVTPLDREFATLPEGTDVLVLIQPPALSDWQAYVVDQYLVGGGRALIAVDPLSVASAEAGRAPASSPGRIAATLGVALESGVLEDASLALPVEVDAGQGRRRIERDPRLLGLAAANLSRTDPVTADLTRAINLSNAGALSAAAGASTSFEPLLSASREAGLDGKAAGGEPVLAARLSGRMRSAFRSPPAEPPLPQDPIEAEFVRQDLITMKPFLAEGRTPADAIVMADVDLLDDRLFANPADGTIFADNAAFFLNALDNLSGDPALLSLRSRAPAARPMTRVDQLEEAGRSRLAAEEPLLRQQIEVVSGRIQTLMAAPAGSDLLRGEGSDALPMLRAEAANLRAQLRDLQRAQRKGVDALELWLVVLNVWAPPLVVALGGLLMFGWYGRRRRRS